MHHHRHRHSSSRVKIIHNVAKAGEVDVVIDGNVALSDVPYKAQSDYLKLASGKHRVAIRAGGKDLATATVDLVPGKDYTVVAHGDVKDLSTLALLALPDNNSCPARGKAHLRFVHAAATAPAVDIYAGNAPIFQNVSYGNTGNPTYLPVDAGKVPVYVTPAGTTQVVLGPLDLSLEAGKVYTVTASGLVGDSEAPLTALVHEDTACATHVHHPRVVKTSGPNPTMMNMWAFI